MNLESILINIGAPILAKVIGQQFGENAGAIAQVGIDALAEQLGVEPTRAAIEASIPTSPTPSIVDKIKAAEERMPELILAQAEMQRAGNEQQRQSNELLLAAMNKGPLWTWAWLYVWQYVLMFFWFWTLIAVHLVNAALRLAGGDAMPVPTVTDLLALTGAYLALHMGGHTVLELMRGKWGRAPDDAGVNDGR